MNRLVLALIVSITIHLLVLSTFFLVIKKLPLAGGDEHDGVSVEIVGEDGAPDSQLTLPASLGNRASPGDSQPTVPGGERQATIGSGTADGTDSLLAQIRARIERAKRYPLLARRSEIEGVALVGFQIGASGQPESIRLQSSSGHRILDDEALATVQRAAPFPLYSKPLEIGIRFELNW